MEIKMTITLDAIDCKDMGLRELVAATMLNKTADCVDVDHNEKIDELKAELEAMLGEIAIDEPTENVEPEHRSVMLEDELNLIKAIKDEGLEILEETETGIKLSGTRSCMALFYPAARCNAHQQIIDGALWIVKN